MRNSEYECWNGDRDCSSVGAVDSDGVAVSSDLNRRGQELPDGTPMAPPVGFSSGPSLADFVQRMIRQEVSRAAAAAEMETFEEADDFDIDDDPLDPLTEYERGFDQKVPDEWPMFYNPETGFYGQLEPGAKAPEGFVELRREKKLPPGYVLPEAPKAGREGIDQGDRRIVEPSPEPSQRVSGGSRSSTGSTE